MLLPWLSPLPWRTYLQAASTRKPSLTGGLGALLSGCIPTRGGLLGAHWTSWMRVGLPWGSGAWVGAALFCQHLGGSCCCSCTMSPWPWSC